MRRMINYKYEIFEKTPSGKGRKNDPEIAVSQTIPLEGFAEKELESMLEYNTLKARRYKKARTPYGYKTTQITITSADKQTKTVRSFEWF